MVGILDIQLLDKSYNGICALSGFSCSLQKGEILGIIGPNGAGKTTLFNIISGFVIPDNGKVIFKSKDITNAVPFRITRLGISRTFQNLRLIKQISVLDNVLLAFQNQPGEKLHRTLFNWKYCLKQETANKIEAMVLLKEMGIWNKVNDPAEKLSYGQQKLLTIACCLAAKSEVLLLDEPVAGIAPETIESMLTIIKSLPSLGKTVILIEHNLDAVMKICDRVIFMDSGTIVSEGKPDFVRNDPKVIETYLH